jgi:hypothetical protein
MDRSEDGRPVAASGTQASSLLESDEQQQDQTSRYAAAIESLSREALAKQTRILMEEVNRLDEVEEQLSKEIVELRCVGGRLKRENEERKVQARWYEAEIDRWRERYMETLEEKVALAEQLTVSDCAKQEGDVLSLPLQGPAKLPLEIILIIAGFAAGNNDYGTLLSLHVMSKRIKQETTPVFYETVLEPDIDYLQRNSESKLGLEVYRFTRYAHASQHVAVR